jgi:uncharacterized protein YigE (DUF2233 family)
MLLIKAILIILLQLSVTTFLFADNDWTSFAKGLDIIRISPYQSNLFSPELLLVRFNLENYEIKVIEAKQFGKKNASVKELSLKSKALMGINANFFDETGSPLGLVISQGIIRQKLQLGGKTLTGIFQVNNYLATILSRENYISGKAIEAIQSGPRLIISGQKVTGLNASNKSSRRSGICIDKNKSIIFYITSGLIGMNFDELQDILIQKNINCIDVLNLDGGGSSQFFLNPNWPEAKAELKEIIIHGADDIPVMLGVFNKRSID